MKDVAVTWYQEAYEPSYVHAHKNASLGYEDFRFCIEAYGVKAFVFIDDYSSRTLGKQLVNKLLRYRELHVVHGPIYTSDDYDLKAWLNSVEYIAKKLDVSKIKIVPPYQSYLESCSNNADKESFLNLGYSSHKYHSIVLDLRKSEDELWKKLSSEARRKVRRTSEMGVEIKKVSDVSELQEWFNLKSRESSFHHDRMLKILQDGVGSVEYYIAVHQGKPLAWQGVLFGRNTALLECNAISRENRPKKIFANYLLQWEMIKRAKERGIIWLDWVGAEPDSSDPKMLNIYRFKTNWGGDLVSYDYFLKDLSLFRAHAFLFLNRARCYLEPIVSSLRVRLRAYFNMV